MPLSVAPAAGSAAGAAVGSAAEAGVGAAAGAAVASAAAGAAVASAAAGAAVASAAAGAVVGVAAGAPPQAARIMVNTRQSSMSDQVRLRIIGLPPVWDDRHLCSMRRAHATLRP